MVLFLIQILIAIALIKRITIYLILLLILWNHFIFFNINLIPNWTPEILDGLAVSPVVPIINYLLKFVV